MIRTELLSRLTVKNIIFYLFLAVVTICIGTLAALAPGYSKWLVAALTLAFICILSLRSPFHAFLIFVITLPLEATLVIEAGFTIRPSYVVLLFILMGLLSRALLSGGIKGNFKTPLNLPIFTYIAIATLSLIFATLFYPPQITVLAEIMKYRGSELRGIIQLFLLIFYSLTYFLTIYFCSDKKKISLVLRAYIGVAFILSLYGIYQFFAIYYHLPFVDVTNAISTGGGFIGVLHSDNPAYFRPHATFQEPLNFGHYLISVIPFLLTFYLCGEKREKGLPSIISLIPIIVMFIVLVLTRSRGSWLGFLGSLIIIISFVNAKQRLKIFGILAFIGIIFAIFASFYFPEGYDNISWILSQRFVEIDFATDPRIAYIDYIIRLFKKYPILGVGIGNYGFHAASYFGRDLIVSAHGVFGSILAETGILGFITFLWILLAYSRILIRNIRKIRESPWYPYLVGYLASFIGMMIQYLFFGDRLSMYVWFFMGISIATLKVIEKEQV